MALTLADLRAEVLSNDFDAATYSDRVTAYINEALGRVGRQVRIGASDTDQTLLTVAGSPTYVLADDTVRIRYVFNANTRDMLSPVERRAIDDADVSSGQPVDYSFNGYILTLYPTPDRVYSLSVRYQAGLYPLTDDTDRLFASSGGFPDDYSDVLVSYARHKLYRGEDDPEMANYWLGEYQRQLLEMKADLQMPSEDGPRQIPSMWSS